MNTRDLVMSAFAYAKKDAIAIGSTHCEIVCSRMHFVLGFLAKRDPALSLAMSDALDISNPLARARHDTGSFEEIKQALYDSGLVPDASIEAHAHEIEAGYYTVEQLLAQKAAE